MKKERLFELLSELDDSYIHEARQPASTRRGWLKWMAAAACLALVLAAALPYIAELVSPYGGPGQSDLLRPLDVLEFSGSYYEVADMSDTALLDRFNLPREITPDMVGRSLGAGLKDDNERTEETFYVYQPCSEVYTVRPNGDRRPQAAVYLVERGGEYSYALFCNRIRFDPNTHEEASEAFAVYGIDEPEDIASITADGRKISDREDISAFFYSLYNSFSMGFFDYEDAVYGGVSEEEYPQYSAQLAESSVEISITTTAGLVARNIIYQPEVGFITWALNYYRVG